MDETKPGERPDTVVLSGLPVRWFSQSNTQRHDLHKDSCRSKEKPSSKVVKAVFETFGAIRAVDIPILDPVQTPGCLESYVDELDSDQIQMFRLPPEPNTEKHDSLDHNYHSTISQLQRSSWEVESTNGETESSGFGRIEPETISYVSKFAASGEVQESDSEGAFKLTNGANCMIRHRSTGQQPSIKLSSSASASLAAGLIPLTFTVYVQYANYVGFSKAMEALRAQKLVFAPSQPESVDHSSENNYFTAELKIDFDRGKHLSQTNIQSREIERKKLVSATLRRREEARLAAEAEEKQSRLAECAKRKADERRRAEALALAAELEIRRAAKAEQKRQISMERCKRERETLLEQKIRLDERRRLIATRKVGAIRLMKFLLARIHHRHDAMVALRRTARMQKADQAASEAAKARAQLEEEKATAVQRTDSPAVVSSTVTGHVPEVGVSRSPADRPMGVPSELVASALSRSPDTLTKVQPKTESSESSLQKQLLERRELILRNNLLKKYSQAKRILPGQSTHRRSHPLSTKRAQKSRPI